MDPGMECEFQINTRSPPPLLFFRRGPQKLSSGSHKDGWGSAACSTFFTGDRWWGFLWQVSVPLQARRSGNGRIAPCRRVCSKVMIVTPPPPSSCACSQAPSDTSAIRVDCIKKDHFKETRCAPVSLRNETPSTSSLCGCLQLPDLEMKPRRGLL